MRDAVIQICLHILRVMGYDMAKQIQEAHVVIQSLSRDKESLRSEKDRREARSSKLTSMINIMIPMASQIQLAPQGYEWKRHQLFAYARKEFPHLSDGLCALASDYTLYYVHNGTVNTDESNTL